MSAIPPGESQEATLIKIATVLWGPFGGNGLKGDVARQREQIGELYGRDEALKELITSKFDDLYKLFATLIISIVLGAGTIVATLIATR